MTLKFIKKLESVKIWTICVPSFKHLSNIWATSFTIELLTVIFIAKSDQSWAWSQKGAEELMLQFYSPPNSGRQTWHISGQANKTHFFTFSFLQHGNSKAIFRWPFWSRVSFNHPVSSKVVQKATSLGKNKLSRHTIFFWENWFQNSRVTKKLFARII